MCVQRHTYIYTWRLFAVICCIWTDCFWDHLEDTEEAINFRQGVLLLGKQVDKWDFTYLFFILNFEPIKHIQIHSNIKIVGF